MRLRNVIDKYLEKALIFITVILVADVLWQVISRYVLTAPSSFTDELAGFLLIWTGLLGAAYVSGKHEHLAIDLLLHKVSGKTKTFLEVLINSIVLIFSVLVMVFGGGWLVYTRFALDVKSAALEIPLGYVYIILPISGLLIAYYNIFNIAGFLKNKRDI